MDYIIREMRSEEYCLLSDFLYEAIYIPEGIEPPPKSVIECPELQEYIVEFGNRKHDKALVAEMQGNVIGAIWVRIMNDYGHIDNDTPSLAMSVYKKYRGLGIGTSLLKQLLQVERLAGYSKISLSVQKSNYAVKMYEKVGFTVADENNLYPCFPGAGQARRPCIFRRHLRHPRRFPRRHLCGQFRDVALWRPYFLHQPQFELLAAAFLLLRASALTPERSFDYGKQT